MIITVSTERELVSAIHTLNDTATTVRTIVIPSDVTITLHDPLPPIHGQDLTIMGSSATAHVSSNRCATIDHTLLEEDPAMLIQAGRNVLIQGLKFRGPNDFTIFGHIPKFNDDSLFLEPGIRDNRYSPQCAISVDGITDGPPDDDPLNQWPALSHEYTSLPHRGTGSSNINIRYCAFEDQNVGVMTGNKGVSLGDNIRFHGCNFRAVRHQIVCCGTQQRGVTIEQCAMGSWGISAVNTLTYGEGKAPPPKLLGCSIGVGMQRPLLIAHAIGDFLASGCHFEGFGTLGVLGSSTSAYTGTAVFDSCTINVQYPTTLAEYENYPFADAFLVNTMPVTFRGGSITTNASSFTRMLRFFNLAPVTFSDMVDMTAWGGNGPNSYSLSFLRPQFVSTSGGCKMLNAAGQLMYHDKPAHETYNVVGGQGACDTPFVYHGPVTVDPGVGGVVTVTDPLVANISVGDMIGSYDHTDIAAWMPKLYHNVNFVGANSLSYAIGRVHAISGNTATIVGVGQNWPTVPVEIAMTTLNTRLH